MIYTSNFASHKRYADKESIGIVAFSPKWFDGKNIKALAPDDYMVLAKKKQNISEETYTESYLEKLRRIPINKFKTLNNKVLLCYCAKGKFCHRHILASFLRENGFKVKEL